jgi:hypothetical protein
LVVWIAAPPTQASQRIVASTMNPIAASTATSGMTKRPQEPIAPGTPDEAAGAGETGGGGAAAGADGEGGGDPAAAAGTI